MNQHASCMLVPATKESSGYEIDHALSGDDGSHLPQHIGR